jgi:hypothetical protein
LPLIVVGATDNRGYVPDFVQSQPRPPTFPAAGVDVYAPGAYIGCDGTMFGESGTSQGKSLIHCFLCRVLTLLTACATTAGLIAYFLSAQGHLEKLQSNFATTPQTGVDWSMTVKNYVKSKAYSRAPEHPDINVIWNGEVPKLTSGGFACSVHPGFKKRQDPDAVCGPSASPSPTPGTASIQSVASVLSVASVQSVASRQSELSINSNIVTSFFQSVSSAASVASVLSVESVQSLSSAASVASVQSVASSFFSRNSALFPTTTTTTPPAMPTTTPLPSGPNLSSPACIACTNNLGASSCGPSDNNCLLNQCLNDTNCQKCGIDCTTVG